MGKHAYLIMAHNNFHTLEKLLCLIDDERNDIFIHIDKKVRDFQYDYFKHATSKSNTYIYSQYKTNWGGFSLVQCEYFLLEQALKTGSYSYFHLLSGNDLPIKKQDIIHDFFDKNYGYEFVLYDDIEMKKVGRKIKQRVSLYHFIQEYRRKYQNKMFQNSLTYIAKLLMAAQIVLKINRLKNTDIDVKYGSQWFSITDKCAKYLIKNKTKAYTLFKWSMCPDELAIQIMVYNSNFKTNIYQYQTSFEKGNMRAIQWNKDKDPDHPYIWRMKDYEYLMNSELLFARKFDEKIDVEIIDRIYEKLRRENEC